MRDHLSFRFADTTVASRYRPIQVPNAHADGAPMKRYDRNNQPVLVPPGEHVSLWRKLS